MMATVTLALVIGAALAATAVYIAGIRRAALDAVRGPDLAKFTQKTTEASVEAEKQTQKQVEEVRHATLDENVRRARGVISRLRMRQERK